MEKIPVFSPIINEDMKRRLNDALDKGWLGMGSFTKEFEDRISTYLDLKERYAVATNTGTSALHLALKVAGVGYGDEVITPSFNYVSDHQAIRMTGADVVMCDIREDNLGIDCEKTRDLINSKTKAIIPLHFAGIPCDQKGVYQLAKEFNLRVIEDACHAFGTTINGRKIGSYGDLICFSFDPVKIITSIDGGCVVTNNEDDRERLYHLRLLGVDKDTSERYKNKRSWNYDVISEGYRYHLTNIMASVGISQIDHINEFISSRRKVCQIYNKSFDSIHELKTPQSDFSNVSPFIYYLRVLNGNREKLIKHLNDLGVDTGVHFVPVHKHSYFSNAKHGDMTVTDSITNEVITLPLHSNMRPDFVQRVIEGVIGFFN